MFAVRYATLTALVVWVGGMALVGLLVAPTTFGVLEAADPEGGRVLAGALFGELLRRFHLVMYACGAVVCVGLLLMKFVGPPPRAFTLRVALAAVMLGLALYSGIPVSRELAQIQAGVAGPINRLPGTDARRLRFDALHRTSTLLMTISMGLGLVSLFWYARE